MIIVALIAGCSIDYRSRVGKANQAVISFLIRYTKYQGNVFSRTGAYKDPFSFTERSGDANGLAQEYAAVKKVGYSCRFDVADARFAVVCMPNPESRLQIGFYVDESGAIRLGRGAPNRSSPRLSVNPEEERELHGGALGTYARALSNRLRGGDLYLFLLAFEEIRDTPEGLG